MRRVITVRAKRAYRIPCLPVIEVDGHSSHITANVIALYMRNAIDLLILPLHCSHIPQPLDIGVSAPLKRALASETDAALQLDSGRIP
jgi:hypothetical protein